MLHLCRLPARGASEGLLQIIKSLFFTPLDVLQLVLLCELSR